MSHKIIKYAPPPPNKKKTNELIWHGEIFYLIFARECEVFNFHRSPVPSGKEQLVNSAPCLGVHDMYASPISAHPDVVSPDAETCASGVGM